MKKLIRFLIRTIPRPVLIRFSYLFSRIMRVWYRGDKVDCPVCENSFRKFLPYGIVIRENALCPACLSLERHRLLWLFLKEETDLFSNKMTFLHVAPEQCFHPRFKKLENLDYITADLESPMADMHFDLHDIPLEDNQYDFLMCNHVMEHVEDDHQVMKEILRVLKPGGKAILQVPLDNSLEETYEDPNITNPAEREKHFLQKDHVRLYGNDYPQRLEKAGFKVSAFSFAQVLGKEKTEKFKLPFDEVIFLASKPEV